MSKYSATGHSLAIVAFVTGLAVPVWAQELAATGEVKLPLAQYDRITGELATAKIKPTPPPDNPPPLGFVLASADLKIQAKGTQIGIQGTLQVENMQQEKWVTIPLLPPGASVVSAGPKEASFAMIDASFSLITKQPGKQSVALSWAKDATGLLDVAGVEIPIPAAGIVTFQLESEPGRQMLVEGATQVEAGKYATIPGQQVRLRMLPDATVRQTATPSLWAATRELACTFGDNDLTLQCRVILRLKEGEGWNARLLLPSSFQVGNVWSADLAGSKIERLNDQTNVLVLDWLATGSQQREVLLTLKAPLPMEGSAWELAPPLLESEHNPLVWYAFEIPDDVETELKGVDALNKTPGTWLQRVAQKNRSRFVLGHPNVTIQMRAADVLESPRVSAELATAQSRVIKDGAIATDLTYQLKHEPGASVSFELPKGAQFLGCKVGDTAVSALREGEQTIRVRLPKQGGVSKVSFSIYQKNEAWDPLRGSCHLSLPKTDVMIQRIDWNLKLPEDYEIEAYEGNVIAAAGETATFRKELCNAETPVLELFYQERGPKK